MQDNLHANMQALWRILQGAESIHSGWEFEAMIDLPLKCVQIICKHLITVHGIAEKTHVGRACLLIVAYFLLLRIVQPL